VELEVVDQDSAAQSVGEYAVKMTDSADSFLTLLRCLCEGALIC
jgi:hypothetical protein